MGDDDVDDRNVMMMMMIYPAMMSFPWDADVMIDRHMIFSVVHEYQTMMDFHMRCNFFNEMLRNFFH